MIGKDQRRVYIVGISGERTAFRLGEGGVAHVIPGSGTGIALREFDLPSLQPAGGILQIQIHPGKVCFPALGESNGGIVLGQLTGVFVFGAVRRKRAVDQIHAVGIDHGNDVNGGGLVNGEPADTEDFFSGCNGLCQFFGKFQQHKSGDPFVGVVDSRVQNFSFSTADDQR